MRHGGIGPGLWWLGPGFTPPDFRPDRTQIFKVRVKVRVGKNSGSALGEHCDTQIAGLWYFCADGCAGLAWRLAACEQQEQVT